jgi:MIT (microtubule interacting and transport) domain
MTRTNSAEEKIPVLVNANINRWSHSSTSSTSAIDNDQAWQRRRSPSRRLSAGQNHVASSTFNQGTDPDHRPRSGQSPNPSSRKEYPPNSRLPPNPPQHNATPFHAVNGRTPATPSTGTATPLTAEVLAISTSGDYFGETWTERSHDMSQKSVDSSKKLAIHYAVTSSQRRPAPGQESSNGDSRLPSQRQASPGASRTGHARHREFSTKGSTDTTGSSFSSTRSNQSRNRRHRSPTQKSMLSKALAMANTAVLLDNAQNFEGAIEAYTEACDLLQQVMVRSTDLDDRKKLSAIQTTYLNRIFELRDMDDHAAHQTEKELPEMPFDEETRDVTYYEESPIMASDHSRTVNGLSIPPRLESMLPSTLEGGDVDASSRYRTDHSSLAPSWTKHRPTSIETGLIPVRSEFMPPPLSPRRPASPHTPQTLESEGTDTPVAEFQPKLQHTRDASTESTSWLDTIDESTSSTSSRLSSLDFGHGISINLVDEIEAEFDAALNAAVDAAYLDDQNSDNDIQGQAPLEEPRFENYLERRTDNVPQHNPEDITQFVSASTLNEQHRSTGSFLDDAEEEERLLDEMTKGFVFDDFNFDKRSKSALPRQSDSSGFSGRTWGSWAASTSQASGTTLGTLAETTEMMLKQKPTPALPLPESALPIPPISVTDLGIPPEPVMPPPPKPASRTPSLERPSGPGVRDRRLSGQNAKQLKIETNRRSAGSQSSRSHAQAVPLQIPEVTAAIASQGPADPPSTSTLFTSPLTPLTSIHSEDSITSESPATSALTNGDSQGSIDESGIVPGSPARPLGKMMPPPATVIRKNMSSSSLKMRNLSVVTMEMAESPITPISASFTPEERKGLPGANSAIPTSTENTIIVSGQSNGGLYLFDDHIGTPDTPGTPRTPNNLRTNVPATLEHCPELFLLRPFWLMRCLYQCIAHPRGGYITTKLFLPRDIWRVKNVKLKAIDEKISQCDLLTAALLKIEKVDNLDAGAVLQELQSFENVMEQVRSLLQKKLGGDVGLSGSSSLFKGSPSTELPPEALDSKSSNTTNSAAKSFASSWRKLRSKSSTAAINTSNSTAAPKDSGVGSGFSMSSLPMTSSSGPISSRHAIRRVSPTSINLTGMGPNANYMSSIAHLFDAVQVIDQIARQVEDPGLKRSSPAHVGLELSVRNAAEFFAFYILRFVLSDVGVLLDKYVKRGSEWVLI